MKFEKTQHELAPMEELWVLAEKYRAELGKTNEEKHEGLGTLIQIAKINLESYGRAVLDTGKGVHEALSALDLAGALKKKDIQDKLKSQLELLSHSRDREDQIMLIEMSKRLVKIENKD